MSDPPTPKGPDGSTFQEASQDEMNETRKRRGSLMNMFDWKSASLPTSPNGSQPNSRRPSKNSMKTSPVGSPIQMRAFAPPAASKPQPIVVPGTANQPRRPRAGALSPAPSAAADPAARREAADRADADDALARHAPRRRDDEFLSEAAHARRSYVFCDAPQHTSYNLYRVV